MARKFDLIPGTEYDALIIGIIALCLGFVASQSWKEEAWVKASTTGGPAGAALLMAKSKEQKEVEKAKRKGFDEGYNTINPALRVDEIIEKARRPVEVVGGTIVGGIASEVADELVSRGVDYVTEEAQGWFQDPEPKNRRKKGQ